MNIDFAKMCGKHSAIYDAYYKQIDPKGTGTIEAMTGAKFLKKSGLSDIVLSRVWDLADPDGKGFLDKPGFLVALKLVSVAQSGETVNMKNIYLETDNPPKVGEIPKIIPQRIQTVPVGPAAGAAPGALQEDWKMTVIERLKYEQLFESLKPVGGMLPGNKVKGVLMDSKLPMDTLGKIWDLADQDRDGNLDKHEFLVAMHLVYKTLEKRTVPDVLPPELRKPGGPPPKPAPPNVSSAMPRAPSANDGFADGGFVANFPKDIAPPPAIPIPLVGAIPPPMQRVPPIGAAITQQPLISTDPLIPIGAPPSVTANADWVVTPSELKRYEVMFRDSDRDKDGLVSGLEVKNVFLQSGVPQNCLAHIWALCDTNQSGKLTLEQFALAMWMVERKQKGIEPPQVLTANMVPPSMRSVISGVEVQEQKPVYTNPELEMISKEIEELAKERRALETEIAQKEADIRIKSGEVRSLQSELDTLSATLKQLEHQRGEAEKRLDDLKSQVNRIREQCQKQEDTINEQEGELNAKRSELQKLKDEEAALQKEYDDNNRELQKLTRHLQNTQLQISSVRSMVTQLMETQRQMTDALLICRAAIDTQNAELVSEYQLKIEPDFDDAKRVLAKELGSPKDDPFSAETNDLHKTNNGYATNGDPFGGSAATETKKPMGGFDDSFNTGFDAGFDAFSGSTTQNAYGQQKDPFGSDAFGGSGGSLGVAAKTNAVTPDPAKDDFGSDPFAVLHAPTGQGQVLSPNTQKSGPPTRPESPSPALPPKKSKVPPPRPAPPRPLQGPARPAQPNMDAFGSTTTGSGFADFADFDNKLSNIPSPFLQSTTPTPLSTTTSTNSTTLPFISKQNTTTSTQQSTLNNNLSLFDLTTTANSISFPTLSTTSTLSLSSPNVNITPPSTASSALTSTILTSSNSSQLTRSTTPHQVFAGNSSFNSNSLTKSATTATNRSMSTLNSSSSVFGGSTSDAITPGARGPTDFSDDPFKDYRYDDLCNIQDPFADDEIDPEKIFKDIDDDINKNTIAAKKTTENALSNEFLNSFDAFAISPVPSNKSPVSALGNQNGANKSQNTTPLPSGNVKATTAADIFDNFADFDAFSGTAATNPTPITNNNNNVKNTNANSNNSNNNFSSTNDTGEVFFDAFSDFNENTLTGGSTHKNSFEALAEAATTISTLNKTNSAFDDAFGVASVPNNLIKTKDPFGDVTVNNFALHSKTTTIKNAFDDDDVGSDAFGFDKNFNVNSLTTTTTTTIKNTNDNKPLFDAFNDQTFETDFFAKNNNNHNNNNTTGFTNLSKSNNNNSSSAKATTATLNEAFNTANFAKFDAFNDDVEQQQPFNNSKPFNFKNTDAVDGGGVATTSANFTKLQNQTVLTKTSNFNSQQLQSSSSSLSKNLSVNLNKVNENGAAAASKLSDKFAADYSKPETFDNDLEEAIKRSMFDQ